MTTFPDLHFLGFWSQSAGFRLIHGHPTDGVDVPDRWLEIHHDCIPVYSPSCPDEATFTPEQIGEAWHLGYRAGAEERKRVGRVAKVATFYLHRAGDHRYCDHGSHDTAPPAAPPPQATP